MNERLLAFLKKRYTNRQFCKDGSCFTIAEVWYSNGWNQVVFDYNYTGKRHIPFVPLYEAIQDQLRTYCGVEVIMFPKDMEWL
jgi:hypothetical protein